MFVTRRKKRSGKTGALCYLMHLAAAVGAAAAVIAAAAPAVVATATPDDDQQNDDPATVAAAKAVIAHTGNLLRSVDRFIGLNTSYAHPR